MFIINLSDILKEVGRKKIINTEINLNIEDELFMISGPVQVNLTAVNLGKEVLVQGTVATKLKLRCFRCNEFYEADLQAEAEEEFYYEDTLFQFNAEDKHIGREDLRNIIDIQGNIEIEELIRQVVVSGLPLKQICQKCHDIVKYKV